MVTVHRHIDCKLVTIFIILYSKKKKKKKKGYISFYRSDKHLYRVLDERRVYFCLQQYRGNTQGLVQLNRTS